MGSTALLMVACARMTSEDLEVASRAANIRKLPVSRDNFIKNLGLETTPSERVRSGARSGRCWYLETWDLPSGNKLHAWDSEYVGNVEIHEQSIDVILNRQASLTVDGLPPSPLEDPPRKSFESWVIASPGGKVFRSSKDSIQKTNSPQ
jgi:hypothetical protein